MTTWEKFDFVLDQLGSDTLLLNIAKGIGEFKLDEILDYIIRCFDLQ